MDITKKDLSLRPGIKGFNYERRQNAYFAYDGQDAEEAFIHGNVMQGKNDVSTRFNVERYMQTFWWKLKPVRDISTGDGKRQWRAEFVNVSPWENDSLIPNKIWLDVPGEIMPSKRSIS